MSLKIPSIVRMLARLRRGASLVLLTLAACGSDGTTRVTPTSTAYDLSTTLTTVHFNAVPGPDYPECRQPSSYCLVERPAGGATLSGTLNVFENGGFFGTFKGCGSSVPLFFFDQQGSHASIGEAFGVCAGATPYTLEAGANVTSTTWKVALDQAPGVGPTVSLTGTVSGDSVYGDVQWTSHRFDFKAAYYVGTFVARRRK